MGCPSTSSLRQAPFDKLRTNELRQAPFDKLPSTSSLRQAQDERIVGLPTLVRPRIKYGAGSEGEGTI